MDGFPRLNSDENPKEKPTTAFHRGDVFENCVDDHVEKNDVDNDNVDGDDVDGDDVFRDDVDTSNVHCSDVDGDDVGVSDVGAATVVEGSESRCNGLECDDSDGTETDELRPMTRGKKEGSGGGEGGVTAGRDEDSYSVHDDNDDDYDSDDHKDMLQDQGWAWFVMLGCFLSHVITGGLERSDGVIFLELTARYGQSAQVTAWAGALAATIMLSMGPVSSALSSRFSTRTSVMCGAFLYSVGLVCSGLAPSMPVLLVCFGFVQGLGRGLSYAPGLVIVGTYFNKRRGLGVGLSTAGVGAGTFLLPPLIEFLFEEYGFSGAFLVLGGIALNLCVVAMLYRPLFVHANIVLRARPPPRRQGGLRLEAGAAQKGQGTTCDIPAERDHIIPQETSKMIAQGTPCDIPEERDHNIPQETSKMIAQGTPCDIPEERDHNIPQETSKMIAQGTPGDIPQERDCNIPEETSKLVVERTPCNTSTEREYSIPAERDYSIHQETSKTVAQERGCDIPEEAAQGMPAKRAYGCNIPEETYGITSQGTAWNTPEETVCYNVPENRVYYIPEKPAYNRPEKISTNIAQRTANKIPEATSHSTPGDAAKDTSVLCIAGETAKETTADKHAFHEHPSREQDTISEKQAISDTRPSQLYTTTPSRTRKRRRQNLAASFLDTCLPSARRGGGRGERGGGRGRGRGRPPLLDWSLLRQPAFALYCGSIALFTVSLKSSLVFLPPLVKARGVSRVDAAYLLSVSGIFDTIGRISTGVILELKCIRHLRLHIFNGFIFAICALLFVTPFLSSFAVFGVAFALFGYLTGAYTCQKSVVLMDMLGADKLGSSFGLLTLSQGVGNFVGPPLSGVLKDSMGGFTEVFMLGGASLAVAALLMAASNLCSARAARGRPVRH